ncbi:fluoride efflux transporter CrcB [Ottowia sp.]|uniref:fluoride efflux transporter CrcB n=1 Tax=Ottowia sp. TaxID=1898956 RepID=UPI001E019E11|nr:fluoride efflux transporter CrcB [Ottowia sp.]MCP5258637.1 fluoride efflux transporter CrcB [Burkholderiaceae bacterium]MCB2033831.1 fluoride efflux transporter CrcB [Ottowia sp.]HPK33436.1 fluoride efflux transporter CrcB [Ottowia sp.]HPR44213.1 fluoride efflux transporter CrcB [Ottowia sp.]HRW71512.1 fluoride efflux transporter CrcB [Ottowia sp.]
MKPLAPFLPVVTHPVVAICFGASLGALARWRLGLWLNHPDGWMPWGTLAANLIGGFLIGLVLGYAHHLDLAPVWRLMIITGFMGALTTFSSFSAEVVEMALAARYVQAFGTVVLHLFGSLTMTLVGIKLAAVLFAR